MGDRYYINVMCPMCGTVEEDVYYAPTCGFLGWECLNCGEGVDLEEYTGITKEDASNDLSPAALGITFPFAGSGQPDNSS